LKDLSGIFKITKGSEFRPSVSRLSIPPAKEHEKENSDVSAAFRCQRSCNAHGRARIQTVRQRDLKAKMKANKGGHGTRIQFLQCGIVRIHDHVIDCRGYTLVQGSATWGSVPQGAQ